MAPRYPFNSLDRKSCSDPEWALFTSLLGDIVGITSNLRSTPQGQTRPDLAANFSHTLLLMFQQQDEIASGRFCSTGNLIRLSLRRFVTHSRTFWALSMSRSSRASN